MFKVVDFSFFRDLLVRNAQLNPARVWTLFPATRNQGRLSGSVQLSEDIVSDDSHVVEFADLAIVDLSKANTPEGRAELYPQLRDALHTYGFVCAINHGYTQAQVGLFVVTS